MTGNEFSMFILTGIFLTNGWYMLLHFIGSFLDRFWAIKFTYEVVTNFERTSSLKGFSEPQKDSLKRCSKLFC